MLNIQEKVFLRHIRLYKSEKATHKGQLSLRLFLVAGQSIPQQVAPQQSLFPFPLTKANVRKIKKRPNLKNNKMLKELIFTN